MEWNESIHMLSCTIVFVFNDSVLLTLKILCLVNDVNNDCKL